MEKITSQHVAIIHKYLMDRSRIDSKLEKPELLDSMVATIYQVDENGNEVYGDIYSKAGKLLELFETNVPFTKFNIDTGIFSMLTLFQMNKVPMEISLGSMNALHIGMSKNGYSYEDLLKWMAIHRPKTMVNMPSSTPKM